MPRIDGISLIVLIALTGATGLLWRDVASPGAEPGYYALSVGQGDATLLVLEDGAKILFDAGPDRSVLRELERVLPRRDRYIDLAVITHPQLDHMNGFLPLLDSFDVGAFIVNGREPPEDGPTAEWRELMTRVRAKRIPLLTLGAGDRIEQDSSAVDILSPDVPLAQSAELNDTTIVALANIGSLRALFTGDAGFTVEEHLVAGGVDLRADILKVGHHGSKYSSGETFLRAVAPAVVTVSAGAGNRYGHPAPEALGRITGSTRARILRTDLAGTIRITKSEDGNALRVRTDR